MRKFTLILVIIMTMICGIFSSCNRNPPPEEVKKDLKSGFSAKADIKYGEIAAKADINRTSLNAMTVELTEPAALKGMRFEYNGDKIKLSYLGLSTEIDDDSMGAKAMATAIVKAVNSASKDNSVDIKIVDKAVVVSGNTENGAYQMAIDKKSGAILKLVVPSVNLVCQFNDFKYK